MSVFDFTDYRCFLKFYFDEQKQKRAYWSYGKWAQEMRVKSPATLIMVVGGTRRPGSVLTEKFSRYFSFSPKEADYFRGLVALAKSSPDSAVGFALRERLAKSHSGQCFDTLDLDTFTSISQWYYYVLRQAVRVRGFTPSLPYLRPRFLFPVTAKQLREAFATLLRLGLLQEVAPGKLQLGKARVQTPNDIASEGLKRFHEQVLERARTAVRKFPPSQRELSGITFAMSKQSLPRAKELIRRFHIEMCELLEEDKGDAVYQLETVLFPVFDGQAQQEGKTHA